MLRSRIAVSAALVLGLSARSAGASELSDIASTMAVGTWVEVPAIGMTDAFTKTGGNSGIAIGYADSVKWDPVTGQLFYIGMDHNETDGERFVAYRESDNTFVLLPQPAFAAGSGVNNVNHEYDHTAIDPYGRHFYFRYGFAGRSVHQYDIDTGMWSQLPDNDLLEYTQCCGGIDWSPDLGGLVWVQAGESISGAESYGGVFLYSGGSWSRLGTAQTYVMGSYHNFAEYNPIQHLILFGGGNSPGSEKLYKLDGSKNITPLADAPIPLGVSQAIHTVDPISGDYLVITQDKQFWSYDITTDQWSDLDGSTVPEEVWTEGYDNEVQGVVAGPISTYGVVAFYSCVPSECHMMLYKHSPGSGTPFDGGPGGNGGAPGVGGSPATGGGGSGSGGTPGAGGTINQDGGAGASATGSDDSGGCGCRAATRSSGTRAVLLLGVLGAFWLLRRPFRRGRPFA